MSKVQWKNILREIKKTKGRFISIMILILLGVSFFIGLRVVGPDMEITMNDIQNKYHMPDFTVQSSVGFDKTNQDFFDNIKGMESYEFGYVIDVMENNNKQTIRLFSMSQKLNQYQVMTGRLPEKNDEICLDSNYQDSGYQVGDVVQLIDENNATQITGLNTTSFTITGFVSSPQFIENNARGSTKIGKGSLDMFAIVSEEAFNQPVYTQARITFKEMREYATYSDRYEKLSNTYQKQLENEFEEYSKDTLAALQHGVSMNNILTQEEKDVLLQEIKQPEYSVFSRAANEGYTSFAQTASQLSSLATTFPILFFFIAALVSLTTVTRMIEEERVQLGTLKGLGLSNYEISIKYFCYSIFASVLGFIGGTLLGHYVLPNIVFGAYRVMYPSITLITEFDFISTLIGLGIALCTTGCIVFLVIRSALKENAAQLVRPKVRKQGKVILLERISFIWRRLSFRKKIMFRNLFRYKQRMFMAILGISGCTALILSGFGLRDSLSVMVDQQYQEIIQYQALVLKRHGLTQVEEQNYQQIKESYSEIDSTCSIGYQLVKIKPKNKNTQNVTVIVPQNGNLNGYIQLRDRETHTDIDLSDDGAVITEKMASLLEVKKGDTISFTDGNGKSRQVRVDDITEMYYQHYIYVSPNYYQQVFQDSPEYNAELIKTTTDNKRFEENFGSELLKTNISQTVSYTSSFKELIQQVVSNLTLVVVVLIVAATLLAFVVLYNLTNINITERMRELSTIQVLGYYPKEVTLYVYRENLILTCLGVIFGCLVGIGLHRMIVASIAQDEIMYGLNIAPLSFLYAILLTLFFSLVVMILMHQKLKNVDMLEALKAVE